MGNMYTNVHVNVDETELETEIISDFFLTQLESFVLNLWFEFFKIINHFSD